MGGQSLLYPRIVARAPQAVSLQISIDFRSMFRTAWARINELAGKFTITYFLLLYFAAHMLQIGFPGGTGTCASASSSYQCVFDEAYVVQDAVNLLHGIGTGRLPLPSMFGALGISIFGNDPFGWRIFAVLLQVGALYFFFLIMKRFLGEKWGLGATMLLGFDTVFFIHGGLLLNDNTMFFFALGATELYLRKRYWISAVMMGFALLSREMIIFWAIALLIYHLYVNRQALKPALKIGLKYAIIAFGLFFIILSAYDVAVHPVASTSVAVSQYINVEESNGTAFTTITSASTSTSFQYISNAIQHIHYIIVSFGPGAYINAGGAYEPYKDPLSWIEPFVFYNGTLQNAFWVTDSYLTTTVTTTVNNVVVSTYQIHYYTYQDNPAVWYGFIPGVIACCYALYKKKETEAAMYCLAGAVVNYTPWLLLGIFDSTRTGFNFYYIYVLPFSAMGFTFFFKQLPPKYGRPLMALDLLIAAAFFIWFFPVHGLITNGS